MNHVLTEKELKTQAHTLRDYLISCGVSVSHSQMLEGLSRVHGWRNLATARANFAPGITVHKDDTMQNWTTRIAWFGSCWDDELDDAWYLYPAGVTLDETTSMGLDSLRRLPTMHVFNPKLTCAIHVYAELSDMSEHGIPDMARSSTVDQSMAEDGFGVSDKGVSIRRHDRGDDGADNYWVEVRMPVAESERLDACARKVYATMLAECIRDTAADKEFAVTRDTLEDLACEEAEQARVTPPSSEELEALRLEFGF